MSSQASTRRRNGTWQRGVALVVVLVVVVAGLWILHRFDPSRNAFYPRCGFHQATGLNCPGCGSQRALYALIHGEWQTALRCNALLMLGTPLLLAHLCLERRRRRNLTPPPLPGTDVPRLVWWIAGVAVAFTVLRNLPFEPFRHLSP